MSSKTEKDATLAQRAEANTAGDKNHPLANAIKGIRQSGRHTEVIRQGNPGRTNQQKNK